MRGTDLARGSLAKRLFVFSGDILEKLTRTEAGAYKGGGAGSGFTLLWFLSKPQNCPRVYTG